MLRWFFLFTIISLLILELFSCSEKKESDGEWTKENIRIILDSIGRSKIIACFTDANSFSILELGTTEKNIVRKLIYRKGYPIFIDSLIYIKHNEFKSRNFNTTYLIKDITVISINHVKIIHPSSNWQGQTPWSQPYVTTYKREDLRIK